MASDPSKKADSVQETGVKSHPSAQATSEKVPADSPATAAGQETAEPPRAINRSFLLFNAVPSWLVSTLVHLVLLLLFAILTLEPYKTEKNLLTIGKSDIVEEMEDISEDEDIEPIEVEAINDTVQTEVAAVEATEMIDEISPADDPEAALISVELSDFGEQTAPKNDLLTSIGSFTGAGLEGRGQAARQRLVREGGGTAGSEEAVTRALKWLSRHQNPDGSWGFDHRWSMDETGKQCAGRCPNDGTLKEALNGSTAIALLPYLGAGHTHKAGKYKSVVERGLYYLATHMKVSQNTGSLFEPGGTMYSHGIGAIALCEAYGMTKDRQLLAPAQLSLNYISWAQDPVGGGWRYAPQQAGDTSAVGWQLMALKSGHMAYLNVNPNTVRLASRFLDFVQSEGGARYGYANPGNGHATTAIGLLCRMYMGWKKDNPNLEKGTEYISQWGPSPSDMYYNYYATQVMKHQGGSLWEKWNEKMRDSLVDSQSKQGHSAGSWYFTGGHGQDKGGRLYCTCLATMILEVYYRHLPIYRKQASEDDFPL